MLKYGHRPRNWFEGIVNKMGGEEGAEMYLRGELKLVAVNAFHETGELVIQLPALKRPSLAEIQAERSWVQRIQDDSPENPVTLRLGTVFRKSEDSIGSGEYERRRKTLDAQMLGFQHAKWLAGHQDSFPALAPLLGKVYIDFPGIIAVGADGRRHFPGLHSVGKRWLLYWPWAGEDLYQGGRLAVGK